MRQAHGKAILLSQQGGQRLQLPSSQTQQSSNLLVRRLQHLLHFCSLPFLGLPIAEPPANDVNRQPQTPRHLLSKVRGGVAIRLKGRLQKLLLQSRTRRSGRRSTGIKHTLNITPPTAWWWGEGFVVVVHLPPHKNGECGWFFQWKPTHGQE